MLGVKNAMKKNKRLRILLYSTALLASFSLATFVQPEAPVFADGITEGNGLYSTDTYTNYEPVDFTKANFPDQGLRDFLTKLAYKTDPDWDGKQLTSDMLNAAQSITALDPSDPIKNLTGLELLPNLYNLSLGAGSEVTDFRILPKLTTLKLLNLKGIKLDHIGPDDLQSDSVISLTLGDDIYNGAKTTLTSVALDGNFPNLETLSVKNSDTVTKVAVKNLPALTELRQTNLTNLTEATVANLPALTTLSYYQDSSLAKLDASGVDNLNYLAVDYAAFKGFDLTPFPNLRDFSAGHNQLSALDVSGHNLATLNLADNKIAAIDLAGQTNLATLYLNDNALTDIDLTDKPLLNTVDLSRNQLTSFSAPDSIGDDVHFDDLDEDALYTKGLSGLLLSGNQLTSFDASVYPQLTQLDLSDNKLTSFTPNSNLAMLNLTNNKLGGVLNIDGASYLVSLSASGNAFTYIANSVPDLSIISDYVWQYDAKEHVRANTYEVDGHWYVNVRALIGDADATDEKAQDDLAYIHVDTKHWLLRDDGTAIYTGEGRPTAFDYDGMVSHMAWTTASATQFKADFHVTAALTPASDIPVNVTFKTADSDEGTVAATVKAKAGQLLDPSAVPTPEPKAGYKFDHWQDQDNNVIDFDLYRPTGNGTVYAIFAEDDGQTATPVKLTFTSADETQGTVAKTVKANAGQAFNAAKVPTPTPAAGFAFDHWEDDAGQPVDFSAFTPSSDATFKAVFVARDAEAVAGENAGAADGAAGQDATDNAAQSDAYQAAYTAAYTKAKAAYDADFATGEAIGAADAGDNLDAADVTSAGAAYQAGYAQGYAETKRGANRGYNGNQNFTVEFKSAQPDASNLEITLLVKQGSLLTGSYDNYRYSQVNKGYTFDHWEDDQGNVIELPTYQVTRNQTIYAFYQSVDLSGEEGTAAGTADGEAGKPQADNSKESPEYRAAYATAYAAGHAVYQAAYDQGEADGRADGVGNYDYADTTMESDPYQKGYTYGYDQGEAERLGITSAEDAGTAAGQADAAAGNDAADNSDQSETYQDYYTAAYNAGKEVFDQDVAAGKSDGTYDATWNQFTRDLTGKTVGYQQGYTAAYDGLMAEYDAGVAAAKADIAAGNQPADIKSQSQLYQTGYDVTYEFPADSTLPANIQSAQQTGYADGLSGISASAMRDATAEEKAAYKQGYALGRARYEAQRSIGQQDATEDADDGMVAMDLTGTSKAYADGYNSMYNSSFNAERSDLVSAASRAVADRDNGKKHADNSRDSAFYQQLYDYFYNSKKMTMIIPTSSS